MNVTKVKLGLTSAIGYITGIGALLPILVKALEEGRTSLDGPNKWLAVYSIATTTATTLIRGWQAQAKVKAHAENPNVRDTA